MPPIPASQLYFSATATWEAMLADIARAKRSILIEQYIFDSLAPGQVGRAFVDALIERAHAGLDVRLLVDSWGSAGLLWNAALRELTDAGVHVERNTFGHFASRTHRALHFFRNHRKVAVIDAEVAYVGGVIISERARAWRDTQLKVYGRTARAVAEAFEDHWRCFRDHRRSFTGIYEGSEGYKVVASAPGVRRRRVRRDLLRTINTARSHIELTTPYLAPDRTFRLALYRAAERGVRVDVLLPSQADGTLPQWGSRSHFASLLRHGIRIFLYDPGMLHAKTAVVDDTWATVGSTNLDPLSLHFNHELNIHTQDPAVIAELKRQFAADRERSTQITHAAWRARPLRDRLAYDVVGGLLSWVI